MAKELGEADLVSIADFFQDLQDLRSEINRKHLLSDLMVICIAAVVAGCDGPKSIGFWAQEKKTWCEKHLQLPGGIPSHDTIGRLLATLNPQAFQSCFHEWLAQLGSAGQPQIAVDGKALRRSHDRQKGLGALFLVSAWAVKGGLCLGQLATEAKSNEITAIPELVDSLQVEKAVVTIDAAGCQKKVAQKIIAGKGDYVLALKKNQAGLYKQVESWFDQQLEGNWQGVKYEQLETTDHGHGREETRWYYQTPVPKKFRGQEAWAGLKTIGLVIRYSQAQGKESQEVRYYLSSLEVDIGRFASLVRGHWGIENQLHWCLDVTFREDESRVRNRLAGENLAWLKRFAISLIKQSSSKESIAMQRRMAGWNDTYLSQLLGIKPT